MKKLEYFFEKLIFLSRWFQLPVYLGLIIGGIIYLYKFFSELFYLIWNLTDLSSNQIMFGILTLIDISLVSNLLIMIIIGGYSTFVSKIDFENNEDRPQWIEKIDDMSIKIKLAMSIVIISAIDLLKSFINTEHLNFETIKIQLLIFVCFLSIVLVFVITKRLYNYKSH